MRPNQHAYANNLYVSTILVWDEMWNDVIPNQATYVNQLETLVQSENSARGGTGWEYKGSSTISLGKHILPFSTSLEANFLKTLLSGSLHHERNSLPKFHDSGLGTD